MKLKYADGRKYLLINGKYGICWADREVLAASYLALYPEYFSDYVEYSKDTPFYVPNVYEWSRSVGK